MTIHLFKIRISILLLLFFVATPFAAAQIVYDQFGVPIDPNATTTPTTDAALLLYPPQDPNAVITTTTTDPTLTTSTTIVPTDPATDPTGTQTPSTTPTTSPVPAATTTTTTTRPPLTTEPTPLPTSETTSENCPQTNPLENDFQNCPQSDQPIIPVLPGLMIVTSILGALLCLLILGTLNRSRSKTLDHLKLPSQKNQQRHFVDQKFVTSSQSMLQFLLSQSDQKSRDLDQFNKLASNLELIVPKNIQQTIGELRSAFNADDNQQISELTLQFRDLLKKEFFAGPL